MKIEGVDGRVHFHVQHGVRLMCGIDLQPGDKVFLLIRHFCWVSNSPIKILCIIQTHGMSALRRVPAFISSEILGIAQVGDVCAKIRRVTTVINFLLLFLCHAWCSQPFQVAVQLFLETWRGFESWYAVVRFLGSTKLVNI